MSANITETDSKTDARVSVIIPCYGCAKTIHFVLDALLAQTVKEIEIIVVNDASPDHLDESIHPYLDRIHYIKNPENIGLARSYNVGLAQAQAAYVMTLHCDCVLDSNYIAGLLAHLDENSDVEAVTGRCTFDDIHSLARSDQLFLVFNRIAIHPDSATPNIELLSFVEGKADLFRRDTLAKLGFFNTDLILSAEDQDLSVRLRRDGKKLIQDNRYRYRMVYGETSSSIRKVLRKQRVYARGQSYIVMRYGRAAFGHTNADRQKRAQHRIAQMLAATAVLCLALASAIHPAALIALSLTLGGRMLSYYRAAALLHLPERLLCAGLGNVADALYLWGAAEGALKTALRIKV